MIRHKGLLGFPTRFPVPNIISDLSITDSICENAHLNLIDQIISPPAYHRRHTGAAPHHPPRAAPGGRVDPVMLG